MKYDHMIIDTNNVFYASHYALKNMTTKVGEATLYTGGIYGSLRTINKLRRDYLSDTGTVWYLFDNAKSKVNMRKVIDPDYKLDRIRQPKSFYRAIDLLRYTLLHYSDGDYTIYETGYEADDIAPVIIRKLPKLDKILVVSNDLDWSRLIDYEGKLVDQYMQKEVYDKHTFLQKYEFTPSTEHIILYKVIRGDKSDNIPTGLPRLPTRILLKLIDDYKDIFDIKNNIDAISYLTSSWKLKFMEHLPRMMLNHQLVSFLDLTDNEVNDYIFPTKFKPKVLRLIYESLQFDIEALDSRVYEFILRENIKRDQETFDDFFRQPTIPRR